MKFFKSNFINQSFIYLVFGGLNKGIPFLLLPILTRILDTHDYGVIAMFMTFVSVVSIFIGVGMDSGVGVYFFRMEHKQFKVFLGNVFIVWFFSTLGSLLFVYLFNEPISSLLKMHFLWMYAGVILASAQFVTHMNIRLWQCEQKAKIYGTYQFFQMALNICLTLILIFYFGMGWEGRLYAIVAAAMVSSCFSLLFLVRRGLVKWEFKPYYIKESLRFGTPLVPLKFAVWGLGNLDRFFLTRIIGLSSTGVYWVSYQVGYIVLMFAEEIMRAYFPPVFKRLKDPKGEGKNQIVRLTYMCFAAMLAVAIIIGFLSHHFLHLFLGLDFVDAGPLVVWLAIGQAFSGMQALVAQFLLYGKKTSWLSALTAGAVLLQGGLYYFLITANGILGAAQALAVSYFVFFIITWVLTMKIFKLPWFTFFRAI